MAKKKVTLLTALALSDLPHLGIKCGGVFSDQEDSIKALEKAGLADSNKGAIPAGVPVTALYVLGADDAETPGGDNDPAAGGA